MTKTNPTSRHDSVPPLTVRNIALLRVHRHPPAQRLVADLYGDDAEQRANGRMHDMSLRVPPDAGAVPIRVVFVFDNGLRVMTTHRVRYLCTDGMVRDHLRRDLKTYLKHEHLRPPAFTHDMLLNLYRRLRPERREHYARKRLWNLSQNPPPLVHGFPLEREGHAEFFAALVDALHRGASTQEAVDRARRQARDLCPLGQAAIPYGAGVWQGIKAARRTIAGRTGGAS